MAEKEESVASDKHIANPAASSATEPQDSIYPTGIKLIIVMASLMLGTTLMALDSTIISVATPQISTQFKALDDVGWYGAAYSMILTATTPIWANFYKYFNPKYVYLVSIFVFEGKFTGRNCCRAKFRAPFMNCYQCSISWIGCLRYRTYFACVHYR